jgi:adenylate cyclase
VRGVARSGAWTEQAFLFADLAGFTALTEVHGDERAADLAGEFFGGVRRLLPEHDAEEVKSLGDGLMIRAPEPGEGVALAVRIVGEVGGRNGLPLARAGIDAGPAVERDGDWIGSTVNVAARLCALARADEVLASGAARRLGTAPGRARLERVGVRRLRNLPTPIDVYRAHPLRAEGNPLAAVDPVCRVAVEPGRKIALSAHEGRVYSFCSVRCAQRFAAAPKSYLAAADA